jgi:hypothetical protein
MHLQLMVPTYYIYIIIQRPTGPTRHQNISLRSAYGSTTVLQQDRSELSCNTLHMLQKQSPTSLKLTMKGLNRAATTVYSIGEDLQMKMPSLL